MNDDDKMCFNRGFRLGVMAALTLARAGASADDLALTLPADPASVDPRAYSDHLGKLATILGNDEFALYGDNA